MTTTPSPLSFQAIEQAMERISSVVTKTPALEPDFFQEITKADVWLKAECFQRTGSFKFRGAYNALSKLIKEKPPTNGVLTYSSGNHAQALALAGKLLQVPITVIMPSDAPLVKKQGTKYYGAEVIEYDREEITREELAGQLSAERNLPIIPPYDHLDIMAGQGTAALELFQQAGRLDALFVCVGGGGLISGCATAIKELCPTCQVVGVEPQAGDDATRSFQTGTLQKAQNPKTIADGARTLSLGHYTFPVVLDKVDSMMTVTDEELVETLALLWSKSKVLAEPTGALALAGLLKNKSEYAGKKVGVIISGGNCDLPAIWQRVVPYL